MGNFALGQIDVSTWKYSTVGIPTRCRLTAPIGYVAIGLAIGYSLSWLAPCLVWLHGVWLLVIQLVDDYGVKEVPMQPEAC
jgi:hypothetical protein